MQCMAAREMSKMECQEVKEMQNVDLDPLIRPIRLELIYGNSFILTWT